MEEIKKITGRQIICDPAIDIRADCDKVFIFDLDGTLANISHRLKYIQSDKKDWDRFFSECINDAPIWEIIEVLQCIRAIRSTSEIEVWIVSGRSTVCALATVCWLEYYGIPYDRLFMRKEGDHRPDHEVKEELLEEMQSTTKNLIRCVFDDRQQVVDMWRRHGLKCCQVAEGNF